MKKVVFFTFLFFTSLIGHAQESGHQYIIEQSVNGKLDFNKTLEKEKNKFFLYEGVAYSVKNFAILLWAKSVRTLGITSKKEAIALWEKIHHRKLQKYEKKAFKKGFKN